MYKPIVCLFISLNALFSSFISVKAQIDGFIDIHNSSLYRLINQDDLDGLNQDSVPVNIRQLKNLRTRLMVFSIGIPFLGSKNTDTLKINDIISFFNQFKGHYSRDLQFVQNKKEFKEAKKADKIPYCFALEGTHLLKGDLRWIDSLYNSGVRIITLGHWFQNEFVVSPDDILYLNKKPVFLNNQSILSPKGKELLFKMAETGIALDLSHLPEKLMQEIMDLKIPKLPILASHSNAYSVYPTARNLKDEQIRMIVKQKGLIGICLHQSLIGEKVEDNLNKLTQHILHIIKTGGKKHISIGTDYEGGIKPPSELKNLENMRILYDELRKQGFSKKTIQNLFWKNAYRYLKKRIL